MYYNWLSEALHTEFEPLTLLKKSERGAVELIRHRTSGQKFILRSFSGSGEVYHKLLDIECPYLPKTYEIASDGNQNLVLEEYIQGDNMGTMLKDALFSPEETRRIGEALIESEIGNIPKEKVREIVRENLVKIEQGIRDFRF